MDLLRALRHPASCRRIARFGLSEYVMATACCAHHHLGPADLDTHGTKPPDVASVDRSGR